MADYIDRAVEAYGIGHCEEAANHVAKAFERAAYALADLVAGSKAPRDRKGALKLLADSGVIAEETMKALTVRDVSLWGWTCMKGRHAEEAGTGKPADTMVEARYALDGWVLRSPSSENHSWRGSKATGQRHRDVAANERRPWAGCMPPSRPRPDGTAEPTDG